MKKLGCLIFLIGGLLFAASFLLFGYSIDKAMDAKLVQAVTLTPGETVTTEPFEVNPAMACQISVHATVAGTAFAESVDDFDETKTVYAPLYVFPLAYKVLDSTGKVVIFEGSKALQQTGEPYEGDLSAVAEEDKIEFINTDSEKFDVTSKGPFTVEATLGTDTKYNDKVESATLEVYDTVSRHGKNITRGFMMLLIGPIVAGLGILVFIFGLIFGGGSSSSRRRR